MGDDQQMAPGGLPRKTLAEWRKEKGFTQMSLAVAINSTVGTIAAVEQERQEPNLGTARKIAAALGVSLDQIAWPDVRPYPSAKRRSPKNDPCAAA